MASNIDNLNNDYGYNANILDVIDMPRKKANNKSLSFSIFSYLVNWLKSLVEISIKELLRNGQVIQKHGFFY